MYLMIDNYDSFVYNLRAYFEEAGHEILVVENDGITIGQIRQMKPEGIIISPGPKTPKDAGISANVSEVFAISLDNEPGRAADAIRSFSETGIGISYLYSFLLGGKGILVFRTDNTEKTREVILEKKLQYIEEENLMKMA